MQGTREVSVRDIIVFGVISSPIIIGEDIVFIASSTIVNFDRVVGVFTAYNRERTPYVPTTFSELSEVVAIGSIEGLCPPGTIEDSARIRGV
jgi:hypothetical protein